MLLLIVPLSIDGSKTVYYEDLLYLLESDVSCGTLLYCFILIIGSIVNLMTASWGFGVLGFWGFGV